MMTCVRNRNARWIVSGLVPILLAGCSGIKSYSKSLPKNLHVTTRVVSGSAAKSTVAEFDVYRVNARCETGYLGRVYLDSPKTEVGIPVDELIYLDFIFASKALMSTTTKAIRYKTTLIPRRGYEYHAKVDYDKGIYNVVIWEKRPGGFTNRIIGQTPLSSCKPKN
jgi:hypothetical protein